MTIKIETIVLLLFITVGQIVYAQTAFSYEGDFKKALAKTTEKKK